MVRMVAGGAAMGLRWRRAATGVVVVSTLCLGACSAGGSSGPSQTGGSSGSPPASAAGSLSGSPTGPALTQAQAQAELQAYLDAWATDGPAAASRAYLAPDQQVSSDEGAVRLRSGRVTAVSETRGTPDGMTLLASMDLSLLADPGAWDNGANDRFVTFSYRGGDIPYQMSFATGP